MQLYSHEQIITVLLQTENILEKFPRDHLLFDAETNDVMRTAVIVKQIYFVKKLHSESLKLSEKLHINIYYKNISKFQIYFSETFPPHLSFYVKLSNIQQQMKSHICLNEHKMQNYL